jgi:hypothetical protein
MLNFTKYPYVVLHNNGFTTYVIDFQMNEKDAFKSLEQHKREHDKRHPNDTGHTWAVYKQVNPRC